MTVNELGKRMTTAEFTEWVAFYRYEQRERERAEKKAARKR